MLKEQEQNLHPLFRQFWLEKQRYVGGCNGCDDESVSLLGINDKDNYFRFALNNNSPHQFSGDVFLNNEGKPNELRLSHSIDDPFMKEKWARIYLYGDISVEIGAYCQEYPENETYWQLLLGITNGLIDVTVDYHPSDGLRSIYLQFRNFDRLPDGTTSLKTADSVSFERELDERWLLEYSDIAFDQTIIPVGRYHNVDDGHLADHGQFAYQIESEQANKVKVTAAELSTGRQTLLSASLHCDPEAWFNSMGIPGKGWRGLLRSSPVRIATII